MEFITQKHYKMIEDKQATAQHVADKVMTVTGLNIFKNTRKREYIEARALLNHVLVTNAGLSLHEVKQFYRDNGKPYDHSTVHHSLKMFDDVYSRFEPKLSGWLHEIMKTLSVRDRKRSILISNVKALSDQDVDQLYELSCELYEQELRKREKDQ